MASSQGHRAAQRGTLGVRGTQAVGAVFGHLGGADGWDMVKGHPSTIAGRQGCWVLLTRPNLTVLNHKKPDLSYGEVQHFTLILYNTRPGLEGDHSMRRSGSHEHAVNKAS